MNWEAASKIFKVTYSARCSPNPGCQGVPQPSTHMIPPCWIQKDNSPLAFSFSLPIAQQLRIHWIDSLCTDQSWMWTKGFLDRFFFRLLVSKHMWFNVCYYYNLQIKEPQFKGKISVHLHKSLTWVNPYQPQGGGGWTLDQTTNVKGMCNYNLINFGFTHIHR